MIRMIQVLIAFAALPLIAADPSENAKPALPDDPAAVALLKDKWGIGCVQTDADGNVTTLCPKSDDVRDNAAIRDAVSKLRHVRVLLPTGTRGGDELLAATASWPRTLEVIQLGADVGDGGLAHIARFHDLMQLTISSDQITDAAFKHFAKMKNLNYLSIGPRNSKSRLKISGSGLGLISDLKNLEDLDLLDSPIDDPGLANLSGLNLKRLELRHPAISDRGIDAISKITGIESLVITDAAITDKAFAAIGTLTNLRVLSLIDCPNVTGKGIARLRGASSLSCLCLQGCAVDDAGVSGITSLPLTALNLRRTKITDKSLDAMKRIPTLNVLYVEGAKLSEAAIQSLKRIERLRVDE